MYVVSCRSGYLLHGWFEGEQEETKHFGSPPLLAHAVASLGVVRGFPTVALFPAGRKNDIAIYASELRVIAPLVDWFALAVGRGAGYKGWGSSLA